MSPNKKLKFEDDDVVFIKSSPCTHKHTVDTTADSSSAPAPPPRLSTPDSKIQIPPTNHPLGISEHEENVSRSPSNCPSLANPPSLARAEASEPPNPYGRPSPRSEIARKKAAGFKSQISEQAYRNQRFFDLHWAPRPAGGASLRSSDPYALPNNNQTTLNILTVQPAPPLAPKSLSYSNNIVQGGRASVQNQPARSDAARSPLGAQLGHQDRQNNASSRSPRALQPNQETQINSTRQPNKLSHHNQASASAEPHRSVEILPNDETGMNITGSPSRNTISSSKYQLFANSLRDNRSKKLKKNKTNGQGKNQNQQVQEDQDQRQAQKQGQKRKRDDSEDESSTDNSRDVFETLYDHEECVDTTDLDAHLSITNKILLFSDVIELNIGTKREKFRVHKDLLALHSTFFRDLIAKEAEAHRERKTIHLRDVRPATFRFFVAFLYTGKLRSTPNEFADIWVLGDRFGIPALQNCAMEFCFNLGKQYEAEWPYVDWVHEMYDISRRGTTLRQFAADSVAWYQPLQKHPEGSQNFQKWRDLFKTIPDLSVDMSLAAGKTWKHGCPWDDAHQSDYFIEEKPLTELWESYILSQKSKIQLEREAKAGSLRSRVDLEHLNRKM